MVLSKFSNHIFNSKFCPKALSAKREHFCFWRKKISLYKERYFLHVDKNLNDKSLFFIIDPTIGVTYSGLADQLKSIVCAYYFAQLKGRAFKLIYESPFDISKYLQIGDNNSMKGHWNEISYSLKNSRILIFDGLSKFPKLNKNVSQYHIFLFNGKNIIRFNKVPNWENIWSNCYNQLFRPTDLLINEYMRTGLKPKSYISAHLRFVNALEHFENTNYNNTLDKKQKDSLISTCINELHRIQDISDLPLIVFSDSATFLSYAQREGFTVLNGKIGHIKNSNNEDLILKTFLDYYAMSQSKKIYRIVSDDMYRTNFSVYAALSGYIECETIFI